MQFNNVKCPGCNRKVNDRCPACPHCGEKIYIEHPGDIKGVKHAPLEYPPAKSGINGIRNLKKWLLAR